MITEIHSFFHVEIQINSPPNQKVNFPDQPLAAIFTFQPVVTKITLHT